MWSSLAIAGIGAGVLGSGGMVWYGLDEAKKFAAKKELFEEELRRRGILDGCYALRSLEEEWALPLGRGPVPIFSSGTGAISPPFLQLLDAGSLHKIAGPIYLNEPDDLISLQNFRQRIPPIFDDGRLIVPKYPALGGGWGGLTIREVYTEDGLALWRESNDLTQLLPDEERCLSICRHQPEPPFALAFASPGPSGSMLLPLLLAYNSEHPTVPIYMVLVLDENSERRKLHIAQLLDLYGQGDLVSLFIVNDNQRGGKREDGDNAIAATLFSIIQAPWLEKTPKSGWNTLADIHRLYHHRVATVRWASTRLAVDYIEPFKDALPAVWFTNAVSARLRLRRSIRTVLDDPSCQSLPLTAAEEPWVVGIVSPIRPNPDMIRLHESLDSISLKSHTGTLLLSSIGAPLAPNTRDVDTLPFALVPIAGGLQAVRDLAQGTIQPGAEFQPTQPVLPVSFHIGGNGHEVSGKTTSDPEIPVYNRG